MSMTLNTRTKVRQTIFIDAGIENILIALSEMHQTERKTVWTESIPNTRSLAEILVDAKLYNTAQANKDIYITGKLADTVRDTLGYGICIKPAAALWQAARKLLSSPENSDHDSVGIIEISASGYTILAVDRDGGLKDDMLVTNPHCGAGSGINLSRVLQKLDIERNKVDMILINYLGSDGAKKRQAISPRADRCGVFSSSATVSDKNQGIPLDYALATTIKSEVLKACRKLTNGISHVYLTGGIFRWQYARDCAEDFLKNERQVGTVTDMTNISLPLLGVSDLVDTIGPEQLRDSVDRLKQPVPLTTYPAFTTLSKEYQISGRYLRMEPPQVQPLTSELSTRAVNMGLDVGSTMAKVILTDAADDQLLWVNSYANHGDTIATIKYIFKEFVEAKISSLNIQNIGITGSGRFQVQKVLCEVYPHLNHLIRVLVENYAHARGSIDEARKRISDLLADGKEINTEAAVLVDVGGEDTKISVIDLERGELLDNAMNIKCSAGTGSLMDTIKTLFGIESIQEACYQAYKAPQAYNINATCAVFLMENASKMRAEGYPTDEIMGSCYWAIVENMARTLWSQIKMPDKPLLLLHGQTMLSDPLPLAVTNRMHSFTESDVFALVPGLPGHRACIGLVKSIPASSDLIAEPTDLNLLIERTFEKKIISCRGAACGDKGSRCNRVKLTFYSQEDKPQNVSLGGCSAINDLFSKKDSSAKKSEDTYRKIWEMVDSALPRTEQPNRLIIPRSFAASEQAFFISSILGHLGLPVHVDHVVAGDVNLGQRFFDLDACAPNIGATGQMQRLAGGDHGMILIPQIDYLPTGGTGKGRTCTVNQGGCVIAMRFAQQQYPDAVMHVFDLDLHSMDAIRIAAQIYRQWQVIFSHYGINPTKQEFIAAIRHGLNACQKLDEKVANFVTYQLAEALGDGRDIAIACGREYVLNPGVYDSHIGRLFRDKGVVAIPSYILNVEFSRDYNQLYWRNPHQIATIIDAVKNKKLHTIIKHKPMAAVIRQLEENETKSNLGLSLVSTFSCGPDSISLPLIQELTQSIPFILVQSDGAIQELAHLENRVNTFLRQLTDQIQMNINDREFSIELLDDFTLDKLYPETDVIYIPTLGDNRTVTSVLRAAGLICIDNFSDETYEPQELITRGRQYAGDSLCAPFAGVFGDTLRAVEDFIERRKNGEFTSQHRILIFNNKGSGPCRQGLYYEIHRLLLDRDRRKEAKQKKSADDPMVKYMVALESKLYNIGIDEWTLLQAYQGVIVQGVLQAIFLKGGANCANRSEFLKFRREFRALKKDVHKQMEQGKPSATARTAVKVSEATAEGLNRIGLSKLGNRLSKVAKFFGYGLYNNNGLRSLLKPFSEKWINENDESDKRLRIHIDGEAYMRISLQEGIFGAVADAIGFRSFELTATPLWSYLEYLPQESIQTICKSIADKEAQLAFTSDPEQASRFKREIAAQLKEIKALDGVIDLLRNHLAKPLYHAVSISMPHQVSDALETAEALLPTGKPYGELLPYIGESIRSLNDGVDLIINVAPSGCMVSTMGGILHPIVKDHTANRNGHMQTLLSQNGEIDEETIMFALLKRMGPVDYYREIRIDKCR